MFIKEKMLIYVRSFLVVPFKRSFRHSRMLLNSEKCVMIIEGNWNLSSNEYGSRGKTNQKQSWQPGRRIVEVEQKIGRRIKRGVAASISPRFSKPEAEEFLDQRHNELVPYHLVYLLKAVEVQKQLTAEKLLTSKLVDKFYICISWETLPMTAVAYRAQRGLSW